jgi:hypothetical protein
LFSIISALAFFTFLLYRQQLEGRPFGESAAALWLFPALLFLLLILLALFSTLTVTGFREHLEIRFGIGLIRKRFHYKDILSCSFKKNPVYFGWDIRAISDGWLYYVSGF